MAEIPDDLELTDAELNEALALTDDQRNAVVDAWLGDGTVINRESIAGLVASAQLAKVAPVLAQLRAEIGQLKATLADNNVDFTERLAEIERKKRLLDRKEVEIEVMLASRTAQQQATEKLVAAAGNLVNQLVGYEYAVDRSVLDAVKQVDATLPAVIEGGE